MSGGNGTFPSWSPDGRWIYFGSNRSGRAEVWRVPADGGTPEQVTRQGGTAPRLSDDGRTLFYVRALTIYSAAVGGGPEHAIVGNVLGRPSAYDVRGHELFYFAGPDPTRPLVHELRVVDVTTGRTRSITRFEASTVQGLTVSPDGRTAFLAVFKAGTDLLLIDNFQ